ncbi:DUF4190 domain-containing protein [Mycobacterium intermedium]|nr:DUF4190 domain-containing protein [Mycobacterium intermedium]
MNPQDPNQPPYGGQQWGGQPPGYSPGYAPAYSPAATTNTMAIVALVGALVFAPLGIVFGHIARGQIRRTGEGGRGLATAGLIIGYVLTGVWVLTVVLLIIFGVFVASHESDFEPSYVPSSDTSVFFTHIP